MSTILLKQEETDFICNSSIKEVVIFIDRAQVKRMLEVKLEKGENSITFTNLGDSIDEQTIKATMNSQDAKITATTHISKTLYFFREKENETVYNNILDLLKKLIGRLDTKTVAAMENAILHDLRNYLQDTLNDIILEQDVSIVKLREALTTIEDGLLHNSSDILSANNSLVKMQEELSLQAEKLELIRKLDKRKQNNIIVTLESDKAVTAEITINYILPGIVWKTAYDAHLQTSSGEVDLSCFALIKQTTGEDWLDATVILSTSQVERSLEIPDIYPVYLSGSEQKRDKEIIVEERMTRDLKEADLDYDEGMSDEPEPKPDGSVQIQKKGVSHTFTIPKPYSIPGDGNFHRLEVATIPFKPELYFETVPEFLQYIYLKGSFQNKSELPLLPGRISVFRNGSYMGRTGLDYIAIGEPFAISFGIDEDIKVRRYCAKDKHTPAKGLSLKNRREWVYHYTLYNYKEKAETVRLKEAIYVSELKEVSVSIGEDTSPGHEMDSDGIVTWNVNVAPDPFNHTKVVLQYSVVSQKSFDLGGL